MKLAIVILLIYALRLNAATYYVDFDAGSDAANGTSTGTPWKHCHGDTNATGTAASTAYAAGDVVKFKGGVSYLGWIAVTNGGSTESPLIFDGNFAGDWGTGRAVIDGQYYTNVNLIYAASSISNLTVRGFLFQNAGGYSDSHPFVTGTNDPASSASTGGSGVHMWGGSRYENIFVHDCVFNKLGNWRNHPSFTQAAITGFGVAFRYVFGGTISNNVILRTHTAVGVYGCRDVTVRNNDIATNIVWGVDVSPQDTADFINNITVRDNIIHDYQQFNSGEWIGSGEFPHTDGIFLRDAAITATWSNIYVFNNHFYCDFPGSSAGGTASIFVSQGASAVIYNNVFNQDSQSRAIGVEHVATTDNVQIVRIYNNTFVSTSPAIIMADETTEARRKIYIANNIFAQPAGGQANYIMVTRLSGTAPVQMDYDLYYDPSNGSATKFVIAFPAYTLWANRMAWYNVETNGITSNPLFANLSATPSQSDLRLQPTSRAAGSGINLSSYFTTDKNGVTRNVWDLGAFAYSVPDSVVMGDLNAGGRIIIGQ